MPRDELHIIITFISYLFISSFIFTFLSSLSYFRDFRYIGRKKKVYLGVNIWQTMVNATFA